METYLVHLWTHYMTKGQSRAILLMECRILQELKKIQNVTNRV